MRRKVVMLVLGSMLVLSLAGCGTSEAGSTVVSENTVVEDIEPEVKDEVIVTTPATTPAETPTEEPVVVEPTVEAPSEEVAEPTVEPTEKVTSDGSFEASHYGITEEDWNQMEKDGVLDEVLDVFDPFRNESSSSSSGGYVDDPSQDEGIAWGSGDYSGEHADAEVN